MSRDAPDLSGSFSGFHDIFAGYKDHIDDPTDDLQDFFSVTYEANSISTGDPSTISHTDQYYSLEKNPFRQSADCDRSSREKSYHEPTARPLLGPSLKVLVCENHLHSSGSLEKSLAELGCIVITVTDHAQATLHTHPSANYDLIIMHSMLSRAGEDEMRMFRDILNATSCPPVVAITKRLQDLPQIYHFDSIIEEPATPEKLAVVINGVWAWKPPILAAAGDYEREWRSEPRGDKSEGAMLSFQKFPKRTVGRAAKNEDELRRVLAKRGDEDELHKGVDVNLDRLEREREVRKQRNDGMYLTWCYEPEPTKPTGETPGLRLARALEKPLHPRISETQ